MTTEKVKLNIGGSSTGCFPAFHRIGDLLCYRDDIRNKFGITLLIEYQHGTSPLFPERRADEWTPVPGAPIMGQIRVALTKEVIEKIRKTKGESCDYELTLENVEFVDRTKKRKNP